MRGPNHDTMHRTCNIKDNIKDILLYRKDIFNIKDEVYIYQGYIKDIFNIKIYLSRIYLLEVSQLYPEHVIS
jgi:hypothetical protein